MTHHLPTAGVRHVAAAILVVLFLMSCGGDTQPRAARGDAPVLRIAEQFGLAYAPLVLARRRGYVEDELPGYSVEWSRMGNATAIREAMIAGRLDIGFMGIPPFLIGVDRGTPWKVFCALARMPMGLATTRADRNTFTDLDDSDRIAVPQPGSIQHILLAMAAERDFADAARFDERLVTLAHPDATNALLSGAAVTAYFAPPPFLQRLTAEPGVRVLLTGDEAFGGPFTFIVGVSASGDHPSELVRTAVVRALDRATEALRNDPTAIADLERAFEMPAHELQEQLMTDGVVFGGTVHGVGRFVSFMHRVGYLAREHTESLLLVPPAGSP